MKLTFILLFLALSISFKGQNIKKRYPLWFTPSKYTTSYGITIGPFIKEENHQKVNSLYIELLGQGLAGILLPGNSFDYYNDSQSIAVNQINGASLSLTGTMNANLALNGFAFNPVGAYYKKLQGVNIAGFVALAVEVKGISIGLIGNICYRMKGLQLGLFNKAHQLKGIQIGLWNVNQKRKLPIINWNRK